MVHERFHRRFSKVPESSSVTDQIFQEIPECSIRFFGPKIFKLKLLENAS